METQVLEGTLPEIQRQLSELAYAPETRVRVTIEAAGPEAATKRTRNGIMLRSREEAGDGITRHAE